MIDWGRISELRNEIGEEDFDEVVELFLEEVEDVLARLAGRTGKDLAADLHYLKGSALNLGFEALAQLCRTCELAATQGEAVDTSAIVDAFHQARIVFALGLSRNLAGE